MKGHTLLRFKTLYQSATTTTSLFVPPDPSRAKTTDSP